MYYLSLSLFTTSSSILPQIALSSWHYSAASSINGSRWDTCIISIDNIYYVVYIIICDICFNN